MGWQRTCRLVPALLAMGLLLSGCVVAVVAGAAAGGTLAVTFSEDEEAGANGTDSGPAPALETDNAVYQEPEKTVLPAGGTAPVAAVQSQPLE